MTARARPGCADPAILRRSLEEMGEVAVRESPRSTVFLVGDHAYKLRRPSRSEPTPQPQAPVPSTRGAVALNASLAPGVVRRIRSVIPAHSGHGYELAADGDAAAIDHVIEMRRFDDADTMRSRVVRNTLTGDQAGSVGARLAAFHRSAGPAQPGVDYRALIDRNFESLVPLADGLLSPLQWLGLQRFASAFLLSWAPVLEARAAAGGVIDGHGDLRPEHILIEDGMVRVIDRPERRATRIVDVADELGTLMMELQLLSGTTAAGADMLAGYHGAGGSTHPRALVAFFGAYRAQVRCLDALRQALQGDSRSDGLYQQAAELLTLSRHLGWIARGPMVLVVSGSARSGGRALATALGRASHFDVLSADPGGAWTTAGAALARASLLHRAVIIDAESSASAIGQPFLDAIAGHPSGPALVIQCQAPAGDRASREAGRTTSDAAQPLEQTEAQGGRAATEYLSVDTRASVAFQVDAVSSWLDSLLAADHAA